jgi:[acyl-carrier-protein] S-malonyltransferase
MAEALAAVPIQNAPVVPVVVNVRAEAVRNPTVIRNLLVAQVTGSVRWRESRSLWMERTGVTEFWEIGAARRCRG